jgi:hypothetical protein
MENMTIPIITITCGFIAWAVYLTIGHFTNREKIQSNRVVVDNMQSDIQEIKQMQSGMANKMDIFIAQENQFLKTAFTFMQNVMTKNDHGK